MYNTPSSRTSKHGAKKAQHRSNRKAHAHSLVSMPVTILPERADPMELPPAEDAAAEQELLASTQLDELQLDVEPETNVSMHETQEPLVRDDSGNGWGVPQAWNEPHEDSVDIDFDPFIGLGVPVADAQEHNLSHDPREAMLELNTPELAPLRLIDDGEDQGRSESISGGLSGSVEPAQPLNEPGPTLEQETGHDSPPVSSHRGSGRTRAPILVTRNPTSPSSLSRQLQNVQSLLPASPQLPSFGFSNPLTNFAAPRITNVTVNGSSFNNPILQTSTDPFVSAKEARRRSTGNFAEARDRDRARLKMTPHAPKLSDSDEDTMPPSAAPKHTRYPTSIVGSDKVVFASFAFLSFPSSPSSPRRLLFIGYENGLQIWDTTHLGEVREILNRRISGAVVACIVLPVPRPGLTKDLYKDKRPLIGIIVEEHDACYLLVYSLASHEVVQKLDFSGASVTSLQASNSFIVVVEHHFTFFFAHIMRSHP
ncbi:hypothetical protein M0805_002433 [Coniferiporia weirii]|nr:hypothetical protein M0805_002433 [Coniferiporia weirii]